MVIHETHHLAIPYFYHFCLCQLDQPFIGYGQLNIWLLDTKWRSELNRIEMYWGYLLVTPIIHAKFDRNHKSWLAVIARIKLWGWWHFATWDELRLTWHHLIGWCLFYSHLSMVINDNYCQISNIRRTLIGNIIADNSDVVGASPFGAAPTTSSLYTKHMA